MTEHTRVFEHLVDQGGLAMVNVGDDGDVADLLGSNGHKEGLGGREVWKSVKF